ncbi:acyltransferase family protein [Pseudonocardia acidicola]|uniref:Acyltransferase n=1 Tax=Pseudonocardia acidicola TaxID=2724939 RepID=A0ABX1S770_9PSEU|nr:acyltransferase [Pseudonocardia acidicola]
MRVDQRVRRVAHPPGPPVDAAAPARDGEGSAAAATRRGRLEFLDALRGIAVLTVVVQHIGDYQWIGLLGWSEHWFRLGEFGVLLFFCCSGFIIPASLERRNDLVEFWIGRAFRLWPLYLTVTGVLLAAWERVPRPAGYRPVEDSVVNLTMLQVFSTRPLLIGASWTLGYELVFYLLVSVLFLLGWHRRSTASATVLLICALGLGGATTTYMLQLRPEHWWTQPAAALLLVGLAASRLPSWRLRAATVGMALVVIAALANRPHPAYFTLLVFSCMFVGTVLYRWTAAQTSGRNAAAVFGLALVVIVAAQHTWHHGYTEPLSGETPRWWTEAATFLAAVLVFGAAFLLRHRRWPRPLTYLGAISYSVYLLHALVLIVVPELPGRPWVNFVTLSAITLVGSVLTHHLLEQPAIAFGRRIAAARRTA